MVDRYDLTGDGGRESLSILCVVLDVTGDFVCFSVVAGGALGRPATCDYFGQCVVAGPLLSIVGWQVCHIYGGGATVRVDC